MGSMLQESRETTRKEHVLHSLPSGKVQIMSHGAMRAGVKLTLKSYHRIHTELKVQTLSGINSKRISGHSQISMIPKMTGTIMSSIGHLTTFLGIMMVKKSEKSVVLTLSTSFMREKSIL